MTVECETPHPEEARQRCLEGWAAPSELAAHPSRRAFGPPQDEDVFRAKVRAFIPSMPAVIAGLDPAIHSACLLIGNLIEWHRIGMDAMVEPWHDPENALITPR